MNFCVVGAGAWGTAFALHLARTGHSVSLVPRRAEQAVEIAAARENAEYLPGVRIPADVRVTSELREALGAADVVVLACPSQALRATAERIAKAQTAGRSLRLVVNLSKGLELSTHLRPSQVISQVAPSLMAGALTGPTNAGEVARGLPAAMVLAVAQMNSRVEEVQSAMSSPTLRIYTSDDLAGVEYGSCLKNIYAIAAGCCDGLRLGDNSKAALITRSLAEMVRVGGALGARPETFYGLSGFGDLVATCHGGWSRNREFGQRLGEGRSAAELIANRKTVVEGYQTTQAFAELCMQKSIEAPILQEMHAILFTGKKPRAALESLMTRELKREMSAPLARV
jgi:glycerol-3-phosphate dehydrogenase (NAD(P)+)